MYTEPKRPWEKMCERFSWAVLIAMLVMSFFSCTKEYSTKPIIYFSIVPENYVATVNGSTANYWKVSVSISQPVSNDVKITYRFNDGSNIVELYGTIQKNTTQNIFYTQYRANNPIANNIYIVSVQGLDGYDVRLK